MRKAVAAYIRNEEGKFLLLYHIAQDYWTPPGGKVEADDWHSRESIQREVMEEVNYDVMLFRDYDASIHTPMITSTITNQCGENNWLLEIFFIPYIAEYGDHRLTNMEPEKHSEMKWFSIEEIKELEKVSYSTKLLLSIYSGIDEYIEYMNFRG